jgi:hypothetical protein
MRAISCAGCRSAVQGKQYLQCCLCQDYYDLLCASVSEKRFSNTMTKAHKAAWKCQACLNKAPKGDNTNTPVRSSKESPDYVTLRRGAASSKSINESLPGDVSREEIREIIRDELRKALNSSIGELSRTFNSGLSDLKEQVESFRDSLNFLSDQFDGLKRDILKCTQDTFKLIKDNDKMRVEIDGLTNRLNIIDQMSRASNLEIECVPEHRSENIVSIVKQLCNVVKCPINEIEIAYCSRIAKRHLNNSTRPRTILVKLTTPRSRDCLLAAVIQYNKEHSQEKLNSSDLGISGKNVPVYVVENLTPENKSLHAATRLRVKELHYKFVWVRGGRIYVRKSESSEAICVRNLESLNNLK